MVRPIDIVQLVNNLPSRPRGRACIVLTHDYRNQKKWAAELARLTQTEHLDLLELFIQETDLCGKIGHFLVPDLFNFLRSRSQSKVLIVSGVEFLKATWSGQSQNLEQFTSYIETWNKNPCLLIVLQFDKIIATREFRRYRQYTFVVDQEETLAL